MFSGIQTQASSMPARWKDTMPSFTWRARTSPPGGGAPSRRPASGTVESKGPNSSARPWPVCGSLLGCLCSASAIGFYGSRGEETLDEASARGSGFLPDVCSEWEAATDAAAKAGIRVVHLRLGIILSPRGGALAKMLTPFRLGVGGRIGSGRQWMSWIALDDVLGSISHALASDSVRGPVNAVAPNPVTNRQFTKVLGGVLWRPTILPMPGFMARLAFGEMADELLLASTRVVPRALHASHYQFRYGDLEGGLRHLLGKVSASSAAAESRPAASEREHPVEVGR